MLFLQTNTLEKFSDITSGLHILSIHDKIRIIKILVTNNKLQHKYNTYNVIHISNFSTSLGLHICIDEFCYIITIMLYINQIIFI